MMAFNAETTDGSMKVVLFARGLNHACNLFCDHHLSARGAMPEAFSIARRTLREEIDPGSLRTALSREEAGLGVLGHDGWIIVPILPMDDIAS